MQSLGHCWYLNVLLLFWHQTVNLIVTWSSSSFSGQWINELNVYKYNVELLLFRTHNRHTWLDAVACEVNTDDLRYQMMITTRTTTTTIRRRRRWEKSLGWKGVDENEWKWTCCVYNMNVKRLSCCWCWCNMCVWVCVCVCVWVERCVLYIYVCIYI